MAKWLKTTVLLWWPLGAKLLLAVVACIGFARIGMASAERLSSQTTALPGPSASTTAWALSRPAPARGAHSARYQAEPMCSGRAAMPGHGVTPDGRVVLNLASEDDLVKLPGVGRKRAQAILRLRSRLKRFRSLRQLLRVRGLGFRLLKRLKPHVVLDPLPASPAGSSRPSPSN
jgi:competence protein ComEA